MLILPQGDPTRAPVGQFRRIRDSAERRRKPGQAWQAARSRQAGANPPGRPQAFTHMRGGWRAFGLTEALGAGCVRYSTRGHPPD